MKSTATSNPRRTDTAEVFSFIARVGLVVARIMAIKLRLSAVNADPWGLGVPARPESPIGALTIIKTKPFVVVICPLLAAVIVSTGASPEAWAGSGYTVSGFIEVYERKEAKEGFQDGSQKRELHLSQRTEFNVISDGQFWRIKALYGAKHYSVYSSDGTNVFSYLVQEDETRSRVFSSAPATVVPGRLPVDSTWYVVLPWLAFASKEFLDAQPDLGAVEIPAPWAIALGDPVALAYLAKVDRGTEVPFVPQGVTFYRDAAKLKRLVAGEDFTLGGLGVATKEKFMMEASGILKATPVLEHPDGEFRVLSWMGVGRFQLPQEIELIRYLSPAGTNNHDLLVPLTRFRLYTTNAEVCEVQANVPPPDRPVWVADYRLQNRRYKVRQTMYLIETGAEWKATNDPVVLGLFQAVVEKRASRLFYSRAGVTTVLFVIILLPPLLWLKLKRRRLHSLSLAGNR